MIFCLHCKKHANNINPIGKSTKNNKPYIARFVYVCFFCSLVKLIRSSYFLGILPCNFIQAVYKFVYKSLYTLYTLIQPWYQMQIVEKTAAKT